MIDTPNLKGQSFAKVTENHSEFRIFIKQPAAHQTQSVGRSVDRRRPVEAGEPRVSFVSLQARGQGKARMKIEWHIELLDSCPKRLVLRQIIEYGRIHLANL